MADGDTVLEICAGISLFVTAAIVTIGCVKHICSKKGTLTLKQSPSMEELNSLDTTDPQTVL